MRDFPSLNAGAGAAYEAITPHTLASLASPNQCETQIVNGKSKVRFHSTNVCGDNFKIKVQVKKHPLVVPKGSDETGVMTMWKRVDVEYRKMPDAYDLPVKQIPPSFEKAFVQMNITEPQATPKKEFMSDTAADFRKNCAAYVKAPPTGIFAREKKPGWFLLVAAHQAKKDVGTAVSSELYNGAAKVQEENYSG